MRIDSSLPVAGVSTVYSRGPSEDVAERRALVQAAQVLNEAEHFGSGNELAFVIDRLSRRPVMQIVNRETNEVIRQIPAEQVLRLAEDLKLLQYDTVE